MPDRSTKTTVGTEDIHEMKVGVEPRDSHQDPQPQGMLHNIKVCTGGLRRGGEGQGRAGRVGQGHTKPSLVLQTQCLPSHFSLGTGPWDDSRKLLAWF